MYLKLLFSWSSFFILCSFVSSTSVKKSLVRNRMYFGESVLHRQFPWVGLLTYKVQTGSVTTKVTECIGTIIHWRYGLTAGHCVHLNKSSPEFIVGGVMADRSDGKTYAVRKFYVHDQMYFNVTHTETQHSVTDDYDVAIMKFATEILFDQYTKPIELQRSADENFTGEKCKFLSWGMPASNLEGERYFLYQDGTVLDIPDCISQSNNEWNITKELHICISTTSSERTACSGASGGPLVLGGKLVGLHVFGECGGTKPSVFARISPVFDWIRRHIAQCGNNLSDQFDQGLTKSYEVILPDEDKCEYPAKYPTEWSFVKLL